MFFLIYMELQLANLTFFHIKVFFRGEFYEIKFIMEVLVLLKLFLFLNFFAKPKAAEKKINTIIYEILIRNEVEVPYFIPVYSKENIEKYPKLPSC